MDSSSPCELGAFDRADLRMWQYYRTVPALYRYRVFGIEFSNKTFPWIFAAQVSSPSAHLELTSALLLQATRLDTRLACRPTDGLLLPHGHALLPSLTAAAAAALASASRMANPAGPVPTAGARLLAHRRCVPAAAPLEPRPPGSGARCAGQRAREPWSPWSPGRQGGARCPRAAAC